MESRVTTELLQRVRQWDQARRMAVARMAALPVPPYLREAAAAIIQRIAVEEANIAFPLSASEVAALGLIGGWIEEKT